MIDRGALDARSPRRHDPGFMPDDAKAHDPPTVGRTRRVPARATARARVDRAARARDRRDGVVRVPIAPMDRRPGRGNQPRDGRSHRGEPCLSARQPPSADRRRDLHSMGRRARGASPTAGGLLSRPLPSRVQASLCELARDGAIREQGVPTHAVRDAGVPLAGDDRRRAARDKRRGSLRASEGGQPAGARLGIASSTVRWILSSPIFSSRPARFICLRVGRRTSARAKSIPVARSTSTRWSSVSALVTSSSSLTRCPGGRLSGADRSCRRDASLGRAPASRRRR
jgi:hypothetical protein